MAFPTCGAIDSYNRADSANLGANWTAWSGNSGHSLASNAACNAAGYGWRADYYNAATYGPDCEAYLTCVDTNFNFLSIIARMDTPDAANGYYVQFYLGTWYIIRDDGGSGTVLGATFDQAISAGDGFGIQVSGSRIDAEYKASGGSWTSLANRTDATYGSAGYVGFRTQQNGNTAYWDDFGGGTISAATPAVLVTRKTLLGVGL